MNKVYKGYELIKAIADGEIKEDTKFREMEENRYYIVKDRKLWEQEDTGIYNSKLESLQITYGVFELIEDEPTEVQNINLDKIIKVFEDIEMCLDRLSVKISSAGQGSIDNYLDRYKYDLQAVKQLNKEIKSIKEK